MSGDERRWALTAQCGCGLTRLLTTASLLSLAAIGCANAVQLEKPLPNFARSFVSQEPE